MLNLSILVEQSAKRNPNKPALSLGDLTLSYKSFHEKVCQTANFLSKSGIGYGDKVACCVQIYRNIPSYFSGF
ncbi:AMP-binding protein [Flavobacterium sp. CS20]|nr:AMP-binding protein [Flavobacterium sp. CS20]